jgi:hypothetical protein
MLWAALIVGAIIVIVSLTVLGLIALKALSSAAEVSRVFGDAHQATLMSLERTHDRNIKQNDGVLDRFMALDFSVFKAYQSAEIAEEGGFIDPNEGEEEGSSRTYIGDGRYIDHSTAVADRLKALANEEALMAEDFDDEFIAREDAR